MQTLPPTIGPYSVCRKAGNLLFTSGQLPLNPETSQMEEGFTAQCRRSLKNIQNILQNEKLEMKDIVKVTVLLDDLANFEEVNLVFEEFFKEPFPARTAYEVASLPKGALIEIEAIAVLEE